jgi:hypothetical protein
VAEGGGLLNRYTVEKLYRGFESLPHRHPPPPRAIKRGYGAMSRRSGKAA